MDHREESCRRAATECLEAASVTHDLKRRATLLAIAQSWFDLATRAGPQSPEMTELDQQDIRRH